ncbi:MAG: hypothetical protein WCF85_14895 [Rhodospirillaceae bacterium]
MTRLQIRLALLSTRLRLLVEAGLRQLTPGPHDSAGTARERLKAIRSGVAGAYQGIRQPGLGDRLIDALGRFGRALAPAELQRRFEAARTWAILHDTVPPGEATRRRDRWLQRRQKGEQRAVEREHRREESARIREQKVEKERQTYSVYFE